MTEDKYQRKFNWLTYFEMLINCETIIGNTGCPKINFTFLNVNNFRTSMRIATPAIYIDRGDM